MLTRRALLATGTALAVRAASNDEVVRIIEQQTAGGAVAAAVLYASHGSRTLHRAFGRGITTDSVFLLASITKPMTAAAVMVLADRKQISLDDAVQRFVPEFRGQGKEKVLVRHLLTHMSGLPDMLPENTELRKRHAPLSDFVAATCRTPLLFEPGSQVKYQSMGILLAGEIVSRIAAQPLPAFLQEYVYRPLRMDRTSLGLGGRPLAETVPCQLPERTDWDWNSQYWRDLGSPWGGALATAADVAAFVRYFHSPDSRVLKPETAAMMIREQTSGKQPRWGLGWTLNDGKFGNGCSAATFGHGGSTGTLCWLDPGSGRTFVLLTGKPSDVSNKTLLYPASQAFSISA